MLPLEKLQKFLFALLIIFLPTQLGLHFWPDWAIINGRRIDYFSPTLYLTDVLIALLLLTTLVIWAKKQTLRDSGITASWRFPRMTSKRLLIYCVTGLLILLNIHLSSSPAVSIYKWIKILELGFLFFYLRRSSLIANLLPLASLLLIPVFYESLLALWQFMQQSSIGGFWYWLGERTYTVTTPGIATVQFMGRQLLRSYGTFPHPNVLGGFLAVVLPLILVWLLKQKNSRYLLVYWVTGLLGYLTLMVTFSRAAIVIGLVFSLFVLFKHVKLDKKVFTLLGLGLVSLFILFLPHFNLGTEDESISVRSQLNNIAFQQWQRSPIIGTGLGTSPLYTLTTDYRLLTTNYSLVGQPTHNIYLLLLSETGLAGFIGFIVLLSYCFIRKSLPSILYPLISILFLGLFDHYFLTLQQGQLLLIFVLASLPAGRQVSSSS